MRRPRRAANACAHARSSAPTALRPRQIVQLACTNKARRSDGPAFVMCPFRRRSAELSSDGTRPRNALARAASPPKRAGSSSTAAKVNATTGPTPGAVMRRRAAGSHFATSVTTASAAASNRFSSPSHVRRGARLASSSAGKGNASIRRSTRSTPPLGSRQPSCRNPAATRRAAG